MLIKEKIARLKPGTEFHYKGIHLTKLDCQFSVTSDYALDVGNNRLHQFSPHDEVEVQLPLTQTTIEAVPVGTQFFYLPSIYLEGYGWTKLKPIDGSAVYAYNKYNEMLRTSYPEFTTKLVYIEVK